MSGIFSKRTIKELSPVLFKPPPEKGDRVVYEVERNIVEKLKIRYDITKIFPGKIGPEFPKTFGHYHPENFPEIYEVLSGWAWWIMQKPQKHNPKVIEEIYLVEARNGQKAVMPPGFGHNLINPGKEELITSNWIGLFDYDYETYENLRGAAYYVLESSDGSSIEFQKNSYYEKVPELIKLQPKEIPEFGILNKKPLYDMIKTPQRLEFLTKPEKYLNLLTIENCFKRV